MVESFDVPPTDRFQVIHQHEAGELIFDRHYPRSDDFLLIEITAGRVRDTATKQRFYRSLVQRLQREPGIDPEDVMVVITTTDAQARSFGGGRGN